MKEKCFNNSVLIMMQSLLIKNNKSYVNPILRLLTLHTCYCVSFYKKGCIVPPTQVVVCTHTVLTCFLTRNSIGTLFPSLVSKLMLICLHWLQSSFFTRKDCLWFHLFMVKLHSRLHLSIVDQVVFLDIIGVFFNVTLP